MLESGQKRCFFIFLSLVLCTLMVFWTYSTSKISSITKNNVAVAKNAGVRSRVCMCLYLFSEEAARQSYVRLFIESARHSGIDIVIVGSPVPKIELPPNIRHVHMTWLQLTRRVSSMVLGGKRLSRLEKAHPRRAIDFKPLFAFLFPELVEGYEWWGILDYDMVVGNVSKFLTSDLLDHYDILCPVSNHASFGPFMLYRNRKAVNELFKLSPVPLERLFNAPEPISFDEWSWGLDLMENLEVSSLADSEEASMSGIIMANAFRLGIRRHTFPLPFEDDRYITDYCRQGGKKGSNDTTCTFTLTFPTTAQQQRGFPDNFRLYNLPSQRGQHYEVSSNDTGMELSFFHFRKRKKEVEAQLKDNNEALLKQILDKGRLTFVYVDGKKGEDVNAVPDLLEIYSS